MEQKEMIDLLRQVASGTMDVEQAALKLKEEPFEDLGFAKIDHHRAMRQGVAEVIYGEGKTPEQIFRIAEAMKEKGQKAVLITRMNKESAIYVGERLELQYDEVSRIGFIGEAPIKDGDGKIVVATGGTSDIPVAEEAARTAETLGNEVIRLYDVGVAGTSSAWTSRRITGSSCHYCCSRNGRSTRQCDWRTGGLPGDRSSDKCWIWSIFRWRISASFYVEFLCKRSECCKYR